MAYKTFPYRTEFPESSECGRNSKTLEDALYWARWHVHRIWSETNEYGCEGEYIYDTATAVITNRNTGYRWIVRRGDHRVEFQTPQMLEETVAEKGTSPLRKQGRWRALQSTRGSRTDDRRRS
jgi:hypothetical protein